MDYHQLLQKGVLMFAAMIALGGLVVAVLGIVGTLVARHRVAKAMKERRLLQHCPWCGEETIPGFGLAGGGYGAYVVCSADECDFFQKLQEETGEDEESRGDDKAA